MVVSIPDDWASARQNVYQLWTSGPLRDTEGRIVRNDARQQNRIGHAATIVHLSRSQNDQCIRSAELMIRCVPIVRRDSVMSNKCRLNMNADDKRLILSEHLDRFRQWTYGSLAAKIERTRLEHDCLATCDGVFDDGTEYHLEFNVFWDDRRGGNVRVCGDITTPPTNRFRQMLPVHTPNATDSFIMTPDGSFVGE